MEWIIPANPKNFRVDDALSELEILEWSKTNNLKACEPGDILYIYQSLPISAITWKCVALDVDIEQGEIDDSDYYTYYCSTEDALFGPKIRIKALFRFENTEALSFRNLKLHGLTSNIQGPMRVTPELSKYIASIEK